VSAPAVAGMATPFFAPVATADITSLRMVRMSRVMSPGSPLSTASLPLNHGDAVGASPKMSSICSKASPSERPSASASVSDCR
jgi:hypothetical protein